MNRFFINALTRHHRPYSSVLPYNLNWMLGEGDPLLSAALCGPITFVDVGCRGGLPDELWSIRRLINHLGFDADRQECDRLNAERHDLFHREIFPVFVGGSKGEIDFHLFKHAGGSSSLVPDPRFTRLFAGEFSTVEKTIKVQTTTLDSFFSERPSAPRPDIVKLDTQGTELAVLQGASECLRTASLVEVEVEFLPMYVGQALFPEVMRYMLDSGFELLYLNRVFQQRKGYGGYAKGQLTFGDALFARREDQCGHFDEEKLVKHMILLISYGYLDLAYNMFRSHKFGERVTSFLNAYFDRRKGRWRVNQLKHLMLPWFDKLALAILHLRRHNGLKIDSDRSWPFR